MKTLWIRLRMIRGFLQMIRNPERTDIIFEGIELVSRMPDQKPIEKILAQLNTHEEYHSMVKSGYMPTKPRLAELKKMPEGSFGRALYDHLYQNRLDFDLFPTLKIEKPIHYVNQRMYLDHDLWHVLLGATTSIEDELAIQGFNVAQLRTPFGALIIAGGILHLLRKEPLRTVDAIAKVAAGYQRGLKARFLLGVRLHEMFALPLHQVRYHCQLMPLP
ncbi:MAG: Coq4 family protein [Bdellovibrionales bacterium]